jgi:hypothetical protein
MELLGHQGLVSLIPRAWRLFHPFTPTDGISQSREGRRNIYHIQRAIHLLHVGEELIFILPDLGRRLDWVSFVWVVKPIHLRVAPGYAPRDWLRVGDR